METTQKAGIRALLKQNLNTVTEVLGQGLTASSSRVSMVTDLSGRDP